MTLSRRLIVLLLLFPPIGVPAWAEDPQDRTEKLLKNAHKLTAVDADGCLKHRDKNEIVVCGMSKIDREQRLPFPELAIEPGRRPPRGEIPKGNAEIVQQGRCYVTLNERNCFKGVPLFGLKIGGKGGGLGSAKGRLWKMVKEPANEGDYVKEFKDSNGPDS